MILHEFKVLAKKKKRGYEYDMIRRLEGVRDSSVMEVGERGE